METEEQNAWSDTQEGHWNLIQFPAKTPTAEFGTPEGLACDVIWTLINAECSRLFAHADEADLERWAGQLIQAVAQLVQAQREDAAFSASLEYRTAENS